VDWENRLVRFTSYKTGRRKRTHQPKKRWVPITARAWTQLQTLKLNVQGDSLFPSDNIKYAWHAALTDAGIEEEFWFRWLRDEAASRWAEAGASPYEVAYLLGHGEMPGFGAVTRMSMLYVKPMLERLRTIMDRASSGICANFAQKEQMVSESVAVNH
jgi:integrase